MSNRAKQLADQVNERQADQRLKDNLQLHKAGIFQAKGQSFWNNFAILFREEFTDFNKGLRDEEYRIESFDDTREFHTVKLQGGRNGASASCHVDIDGQKITAQGKRPGSQRKLELTYTLVIDDRDNVRIKNGDEILTESDIALEVLKFFAE